MGLAETAELAVALNLKGDFTQGIGKAQKSLGGFQRSLGQTARGARTLVTGFAKVAAITAGAAAAGIGAAVKVAADFEEQLRVINTVADVSDKQLQGIGQGIRDLAVETGVSTTEIAAGYYDLVSAGIAAGDAQKVLSESVKLGLGGLATSGEAIDLITTALNSYGMKAKDVEKISNAFAFAVAGGKTTIADIAASFSNVGPLASAYGINLVELTAFYAQYTAQGASAGEATTVLNAAITALIKPTGDLEKMQKKLKVSFADVAKEKGLAVAYQMMTDAAERLDIPITKLIGRKEALAFQLQVTGKNAKLYTENLRENKQAIKEASLVTQQYEERQKGFNASMNRLRETVRDVGITIGTELLPPLSKAFDHIARTVRANKPAIQAFAKSLGKIFSEALTPENINKALLQFRDIVTSLPIEQIKTGINFALQVGKKAVDLFTSLPPELQGGLVALLAANKLSGGLIGAGLSGLVQGILKTAVSTITAGAVYVNGPIAGGGGGGVAGGKGGGLLGKVVGGAAIAGGVAAQTGMIGGKSDIERGAGALGIIGGGAMVAGPIGAAAGGIVAAAIEIKNLGDTAATATATLQAQIDSSKGASAGTGASILQKTVDVMRGSLETRGDVLFGGLRDLFAKGAMRAGQAQVDDAILTQARNIANDSMATRPALVFGLAAIRDAVKLSEGHNLLTNEKLVELKAIQAQVEAKVAAMDSNVTGAVGRTTAAVQSQDLSVTVKPPDVSITAYQINQQQQVVNSTRRGAGQSRID